MRKKRRFILNGLLTIIVLLIMQSGYAQTLKTITGKVTDTTGLPIANASVKVKGRTTGVISDAQGNYSIRAAEGDVIEFSSVGYITEFGDVRGDQVDISLSPAVQVAGDEIVVVGYATQRRENLTGSVSTVDTKALQQRPVANISQALQGVVPGLNFTVNSNGGELNNTMSMNIRGVGTIGTGSNSGPLVLIDGVVGDINTLNPQDVANISVLKDAAASAIYGARAPFGVILITTKSGKSGRITINYNNNFRYSDPLNQPKMMDSYTFARFFNRAAENGGQAGPFSEATLQKILDFQAGKIPYGTEEVKNADGTGANRWAEYSGAFGNTDWFNTLYRRWVPSQDHNLSVSGGGEKMNYYVSGNYMRQNGLNKFGQDKYYRYNLTGKINADITEKVKMMYNTRWIRANYDRPAYMTGLFYHNIARRWPTNPAYDPNGYPTIGSEIIQIRDGGRDEEEKNDYINQLRFTVTPIRNWNIVADGSIKTFTRFGQWEVLPVYAHDVAGQPYLMSWDGRAAGATQVNAAAWKDNYYSTNIYTDYSFALNNVHNFKMLVGSNTEKNNRRDLSAQREGLITPNLVSVNTATTNDRATGGYADWAVASFFGRLNYDFNNKYLFELNANYQGSSRFVGDKRWGFFKSASFGWNIANEEFWAAIKDKISMLKLRASYGELGNQNTEALYPFYLTLPYTVKGSSWLPDPNGIRPNIASQAGLVSQDMTWETVQDWNIGVDWAMLNRRFTGTLDVYNRKTLNMIGPAPTLPATLGTSVPRVNNADMESYGFDLELSWRDNIGAFDYGIKAVLSDGQQKVTRYPNENYNLGDWYIGRLNGEIWGYETIGIAKTQEEMDAHLAKVDQSAIGNNWGAGDIMYKDLNGDGKINSGANTLDNPGDRKIIGNSNPRYRYGITLDGTWKGINLAVFLQGVGKRDIFIGGPYFWGANGGMWQSAGFKEHWDFFRPEGDPYGANVNSYYPRPDFNRGDKNQYAQTRYLQNAAYMRIKNIQLSYSLPQNIINQIKLTNAKVYISAENMVTFTKLSTIFDPEAIDGPWGQGKVYPLSKVISFGINLTF